MYTSFFGLKTKPFQLTPDPEFLFLSKIHKKTLTYLNYGITSDSGGFILVTGEVGTGKTTVIRSLIKDFKKDVIFSHIKNTRLTSEELISAINEDFNLAIKEKGKIQLLSELTDFLIEQYGNNNKPVLIIDESQNLTSELLEEIRLLSNIETDNSKLLQIILVGQPELRKTLAKPELRALRQRINISCHLYPLTNEETEQYIFHRLNVAGNRNAVNFENGSINLIHKFAKGIPRLINIVCDFLLLCAYIEKTNVISEEMVKEVINDLEREVSYWTTESPEENASNLDKELRERLAIQENTYEMEKAINLNIDRLKTNFERFNEGFSRESKSKKLEAIIKDIEERIKEIKSWFSYKPK